jgi:DNA (cytosine-5)-methyltransferase 1
VLSAERYGVPQTRKRAFLAASLTGPVSEPPATHQRYVAPTRRDEETLGLFDAPEPERIVLPEDRGLLPWASMAEALGWEDGSAAAYRISRGTGRIERHGDRPPTPASEPAAAVTAHARSAEWAMRADGQSKTAVRRADEPAPTIKGGNDTANRVWVLSKSDDRSARAQRGEAGNRPQPVDAPAPTIHTRTDLAEWTTERRATAVMGDPRIAPPGYRGRPEDYRNGGKPDSMFTPRDGQSPAAVRVTLREALILQAFDPDLPVQGTRTKQFEQVGNAVPPPLAHAVLNALGVGA